MKRGFVLLFLVLFFGVTFVIALDQVTLGQGDFGIAGDHFYKIAEAEGLSLTGNDHFWPEDVTAAKICELTSSYYGILGLVKPYPNYVAGSMVLNDYAVPSGDYNYKWEGGAWARRDAMDYPTWPPWSYFLDYVTCEEDPCSPETCVSLGAQCGTPDDGCGIPLPSCGTCQAVNGTNPCNVSTYLCEPVCDAGWDSCDGNEVNGCETELGTDSDCSACGEVCGGTTSCVSGSCIDTTSFNRWINMNGENISSADLGDYVRFLSDDPVPYDIFEGTDDANILYPAINENYWQTAAANSNGYNFSSSSGFSDGLLIVGSGGNDEIFTLDILSPLCGRYFDAGSSELIQIDANDPDDLVTGNISINDVWVTDFDNTGGNIINYTYLFSEAGNAQIVVLASNSDGKNEKVVSNIMVYDSSDSSDQFYTAACIDSPKNFERFDTYKVNFVAASSLGLKYDGTAHEIPKELLYFDWTFLLSTDEWGAPCAALGNSHCVSETNETIWNFTRKFPTVNDNEVFLTVSIPDDVVLNF